MSLKRVCDFCGSDYDGQTRKYHDIRPDGVHDIRGINKDIDKENEYREPSANNSYTMRIQFTLLPIPSIELDVCPDCCLQRLIAYVEKLSKRTVRLE